MEDVDSSNVPGPLRWDDALVLQSPGTVSTELMWAQSRLGRLQHRDGSLTGHDMGKSRSGAIRRSELELNIGRWMTAFSRIPITVSPTIEWLSGWSSVNRPPLAVEG